MTRPDALLFTVAFAAYLLSFLGYIVHVGLGKPRMGTLATLLVGCGLIPHTAALAVRWITQGHVPLANMYEYMGLMAWMVMVGLLAFVRRYRNHRIGVFFSPIAVMLLVTASLLPSDANRQLMPALQSAWLAIHVTLAALGSGAFLMGFAASSLYLLGGASTTAQPTPGSSTKERVLFLIFWIGVPLLATGILLLAGVIPASVRSHADARLLGLKAGAFTSAAIGGRESPLLIGRVVIGLGMGMLLAAVLWPMACRRHLAGPHSRGRGVRVFVVVVLSLLLSSVIAGFLVHHGIVRLTPRSYFKIFEFFGIALVISWPIVPILHRILVPGRGGWIERLGLARPALEDIAYGAVSIGYPLYTIGALFAGAIWAEQAWGTWWSWDPKEVGALIIWLFYTGYLHARYQRQWRGDRAAVLVVFGMVMIFVSFFGNYFFGGLHSFEVG